MKRHATDTWIWLAHQAKRPDLVRVIPKDEPSYYSYHPRVPPKKYWPKGFDGGDGVSGWADRWVKFEGFEEAFALRPFSLVDVTPLAWWHDLWYFLGYFVPWDTPWAKIRSLRPRPRSERNWIQRRACDRHFRVGLLYLGLPRWRAMVAWRALRKLGTPYYFDGGPAWTCDT